MKISVHLSFDGQCGEAFATYADIFNGTIVFHMKYRESPMAGEVPADWQDKIYHATLTIAGLTLMGGDLQPLAIAPQGCSLIVNPDGHGEAHRIFDALEQGGVVKMPMQETFWAAAFGVVVDRFGVEWSINCEAVPEVS
jgi:PhnB protein